ncbi:hypothetical protein N782_01045 [Pontibacillus yanchengensis Y32]|uniref:Uncharacterized protein n=1 Tax=Pontibacillus yanchengensis Y32 TaxID=1385514 RepID=A0A0A2TGM6_9BACI|nr:hypothetical protein N782_01045 [Pontibacillus yanchengensis Y32]
MRGQVPHPIRVGAGGIGTRDLSLRPTGVEQVCCAWVVSGAGGGGCEQIFQFRSKIFDLRS